MSVALTADRVACTVLRHAWEPTTTWPGQQRPFCGVAIDLVCTRCGTYRRDVVDSFVGNLVHRSYRYPANYSVPKDVMPKLDDVRLAYLDNVGRRPKRQRRR